MHVIEWVTKTVNRDGKNLRHIKSQKINVFLSFLYFRAFNLSLFVKHSVNCKLRASYINVLMKQKIYALDAFFIEKLKLSENDPHIGHLYLVLRMTQEGLSTKCLWYSDA